MQAARGGILGRICAGFVEVAPAPALMAILWDAAGVRETPVLSLVWAGWAWLIAIAVIVAAVALWWTLIQRQAQRFRRTCQLEIANQGNVRSHYELRAEEPNEALLFTFALRGVRLAGQGALQPTQIAQPPTQTAQSPPQRSGPDVGKAQQAKSKAMATGGAVAGILGTVGSLLPRSVGGPLRERAAQIRAGQASVRRVERLPSRVGRLAPRSAPTPPAAPAVSRRQAEPAAPSIQLAAPAWARTPPVEPGQTLVVDLLVDPVDPYRTQRYDFKVLSRSLEQPDAPVLERESGIQIVSPTLLQRYGPFVLVLIVATAIILVAFTLIGGGA